ncbi:MAG: hypothetical protein KKF85_09325 [Gammaproteobacteria bacterium]|nr:hypothetical protein [Rhodocyclaceae bacterium]MBU3908131.1 hypothetical protein [Gammaproteobacteria bacterium]MBU4005772.1 hypothetical protein [Gammaproteobacteria bacterium]MBU4021480.1 hypothetical protein [Gammaproteobacteria bacterium]MBU4097332.1 hypothetical protein [Gammaproteobacteria bacterium]
MSRNKTVRQAFTRLAIPALLAVGLSPAVAQETVDVEKLFKEGIFQREQGNVFTSIEALETVLSNQPSLHRARLELAVAYFRAMNYEQAQQQAQRVLDDPKTPENVRLAVLAFMAQIKRDQAVLLAKRHTWEPSVSLGLMYDSNVNVGPSSATIPGTLFVLDPGSLPRSDEAGVVQAGIAHTYNSPTVMRLGETATRFIWQSRAGLYNKAYFSESAYNLTALSVATGPGWIAPNKWRANINLQLDDLYLGSSHLALYTSLAPSVTWQLKSAELTWNAIFLNKDFKRAVDNGRNSDYVATGLSYGHLFNQGKVAVQGGVTVFDEKADASRFGNDGWEAFIGANFVAWQNGTVFARYNYKEAKYKGNELVGIPLPLTRDETEDRYEIGFGHNLKEGALANWKLSGSWQQTRARSNVSIYTYDREVVSVNLGRSF